MTNVLDALSMSIPGFDLDGEVGNVIVWSAERWIDNCV